MVPTNIVFVGAMFFYGASWLRLSRGGCQPTDTHLRRARTSDGRFMWSDSTVARPEGAEPRIVAPSFAHEKCSRHTWRLGSKRRTKSLVSGSAAAMRLPLNSLHAAQASHKLSSSVGPPNDSGMMWSTSIGVPTIASVVKQYPHLYFECADTRSRNALGIWDWLMGEAG